MTGERGESMDNYSDLVVEFDDSMKMRIAGYQDTWRRPMIISDTELPAETKGKQTALISPASVLDSELNARNTLAGKSKINVTDHVNAALGVATHYKKQKGFKETDHDLIVVDVYERHTDICCLKNERGNINLVETHRVDHEVEMSADSLYLIPILRRIDGLIYRRHIPKAVIMLSGRIWLCQETVQMVKKRMEGHRILSYRPEVAAILGGVAYLHDHKGRHTCYMISDRNRIRSVGCLASDNDSRRLAVCDLPDDFESYHCRDIWGEVNKLNPGQQEGYWKTLEAVMNGHKEVILRGTVDDLSVIYQALHVDFPEVCILWEYSESKYTSYTTGNISYIKIFLKYYPSGENKLTLIKDKADEILREIMGGEKEYSDEEIIHRLYLYMSEHYQYTKEETTPGEYPEYAYTLETLLRDGVCHGYATSMIYLLRKVQIPIHYICGDADGRDFGAHAWNMVQTIDGCYRHLDITWDLEKVLKDKELKHYLLDDIEMKARRHFWKAQNYPACR